MDDLIYKMHEVLGTALVLYHNTQGFHWNVTGESFYQAHKLFQDQYEEQFAAYDAIAENIRALDEIAPQSLVTLLKKSRIQTIEHADGVGFKDMCAALVEQHDVMIYLMNEALELAVSHKEQGLANFLGGRLEEHQKQRWMLKSSAQ